jgi:hypothetical protein
LFLICAFGPANIDAIARFLQEEWRVRRHPSTPKTTPGPIPWLGKTVYTVLRPMLEAGVKELFNERINEHSRHQHGQRSGLNPFQFGLLALFADAPKAMSAAFRERMAKELWYAYRHYVPPEFLLGFLSQVRSPGLARRSADGEIEPGFEQWIIRAHSAVINDEEANDDARGTYPKPIEKAAKRLAKTLAKKAEKYQRYETKSVRRVKWD